MPTALSPVRVIRACSTQDIARQGFIRAKVFLPLLVAVAAFGVHGIQGWYTDPLAKVRLRIQKDEM